MELISKGISAFGNYRTELYQLKNGQFAVWFIPINRDPSDSELARFERLSGDDYQEYLKVHKLRPVYS